MYCSALDSDYLKFSIKLEVFSATVIQRNKSSTVIIKVPIFPLQLIKVITLRFSLNVFIESFSKRIRLSGETAFDIASAFCSSSYLRTIFASIFNFSKLLLNKHIDEFDEGFNLFYWNLGASSYVVASSSS